MIRRANLFNSNFFIVAIALSLAWHLLCIGAIKIVVSPGQSRSVKFSKVSFLGPILASSNAEIRLEPKSRSFLEKRYLAKVEGMAVENDPVPYARDGKICDKDGNSVDAALSAAITKVLGSKKLEPPSNLDPII